MKKSSLLHNPKDMLSRTFKPAKCKTALKLATSRMKLLKNKKEVQLRQMKRELAQLLETGQDQTARIRVEHVIREEKMMAAYDLLDIYCELIVARLPIIESRKECPIDLKEAITSVIFASPRCGDVPELLDARKLLSAKYGKEFVTAAIELRPNCGVSRLLVEKLSANAPDGQTKIKALTKIAEEHNIKWDPDSFGQSDILPPDDLLNGPKSFDATTVLPEATPNFQPTTSHGKTVDEFLNLSQQNVRSPTGSHDFASRHNSISGNTPSSIPRAQVWPLGLRQEKEQLSQSFQVEGSSSFDGQPFRQEKEQVNQSFQGEEGSSFRGQHWNMEFKDATSAAQAAAESAERASMAARAAAELSSRAQTATQPQFSSEAHNSMGHVRRDEKTARHATSKHNNDNISQDSAKSSLSDRQPRFQSKPTDMFRQENRERSPERSYGDGHHRGNGHGHIASPRSEASVLDETFAHRVQVPDGNLQKSLNKEEEIRNESSMQRQSGKSEPQGINHRWEGYGAENFAYSGEEMIRKQSRILSPGSHASISGSDDEFSNSGHQMFDSDAGKGFSLGNDEQNARGHLPPGHDAAAAPVIFDDSGSDDEDILWSATGFKVDEELNLHFASPGRNSPSNLPTNSGNESLIHTTAKSQESGISDFFTKNHSFAEFSERLEAPKDSPQEDNFGHVTFDDSDGASSENETDILHSEHGDTENSRYPMSRQSQSLEFSGTEIHRNDSQKTEIIVGSSEKFISGESPIRQSSSRLGKSGEESSSTGTDEVQDNIGFAHLHGAQLDGENSDDGKELNFKNLTGGFRQKGYFRPPYKRNQLDDTSFSSNRVSDEDTTTIRQSAAASTVEISTETGKSKHVRDGRSSRVPNSYSDSDSDNSVEELKVQPASLRQTPGIQDRRKDVKTPSSLRGSVTYFDSDSSDSEDDSAKQVVAGKSHVGSGFSRRTKPSVTSSTSAANPKAGSSHRVRENSFSGSERTPTTRFSPETPQESLSWNQNSDQRPKSELTSSGKVTSKATVSNPKAGLGSRVLENSDSGSEKTPTTRFSPETPQESLSWNRSPDQRPKSELTSSGKVTSKATVSNPKAGLSSRVRENSDSGSERTPTTRFSPETPQEPLYWNRNSDHRPKSEQTSSGRVASKASLVSQTSLSEKNRKSSVVEPPANAERKVAESTENQKAPSGTTIGKEDSLKKPSHVHPKLPDYDTLAARLQALRTNR